MQLLFEGSDESGGCEGLGLIRGKVSLRHGAGAGAAKRGARQDRSSDGKEASRAWSLSRA
jgi:hypothetical protein